jgi:hypothetical protein
MFRKTVNQPTSKISAVACAAITVVLASTRLLSQPAPGSSVGLEFPVIMRQKVVAGRTLVGTKVQAKLTVATLVNGVVVPQDAILSGRVTESVAKSATNPSRLAIRMDFAQWKSRSVTINVYLTAWYYPLTMLTTRDFEDDPPSVAQPPMRGGKNSSSDSRNPALQPFPVPDPNADKNTGLAPSSAQPTISKHRVLMANIESKRNKNDGAVTLTSKRFNIKLDKQTTYVLAVGDLGAGPG